MNSFIIADTTDITDIINKNILLNNFIHTTKFSYTRLFFFLLDDALYFDKIPYDQKVPDVQ